MNGTQLAVNRSPSAVIRPVPASLTFGRTDATSNRGFSVVDCDPSGVTALVANARHRITPPILLRIGASRSLPSLAPVNLNTRCVNKDTKIAGMVSQRAQFFRRLRFERLDSYLDRH